MGCSCRVSCHKSVVFTGRVDGFDILEQDEIIEANFVTVQEVFAAEIGDNLRYLSDEALDKLVAVTRAEHRGDYGCFKTFIENLLQHDY